MSVCAIWCTDALKFDDLTPTPTHEGQNKECAVSAASVLQPSLPTLSDTLFSLCKLTQFYNASCGYG